MSDIVERLREEIIADAFSQGWILSGKLADRVIRERADAADEIERLQEELRKAREVMMGIVGNGEPIRVTETGHHMAIIALRAFLAKSQ